MDKDIVNFRKRRYDRLVKRGIRADADWEENEHPRDEGGQFTSKGGESDAAKSNKSDKKTKAVADSKTKSVHAKAVEELSSSKYSDGTYDIDGFKPIEYDNGFQVTFCQIGDDYSDDDYAKKVNECLKRSSDGRTCAGKFEGTPEVSFHFNDKDEAIKYARENNQISIWDWETGNEIKTGGTGTRK